MSIPFFVGVFLALAVGVLARRSGLDRDRAFYPVIMIVIAAYYVLFAAMGESVHALWLDSIVGLLFIVLSIVGFRRSLWIVVGALAGHGVMDLFHARVISNPGVPEWWPHFCSAYDIAAAAFLAWLLKRGRVRTAPVAR